MIQTTSLFNIWHPFEYHMRTPGQQEYDEPSRG